MNDAFNKKNGFIIKTFMGYYRFEKSPYEKYFYMSGANLRTTYIVRPLVGSFEIGKYCLLNVIGTKSTEYLKEKVFVLPTIDGIRDISNCLPFYTQDTLLRNSKEKGLSFQKIENEIIYKYSISKDSTISFIDDKGKKYLLHNLDNETSILINDNKYYYVKFDLLTLQKGKPFKVDVLKENRTICFDNISDIHLNADIQSTQSKVNSNLYFNNEMKVRLMRKEMMVQMVKDIDTVKDESIRDILINLTKTSESLSSYERKEKLAISQTNGVKEEVTSTIYKKLKKLKEEPTFSSSKVSKKNGISYSRKRKNYSLTK